MSEKKMDMKEIEKAVREIAAAISSSGCRAGYALVGIQQQGVPLAERLAHALETVGGSRPLLGKLDISMYRDDIGSRTTLPKIRETDIPFDIEGRDLILVDDVLSTGRTIRAALDAVTDYGRPSSIKLAVLVDRGNREFPIRADFVGAEMSVPADAKVEVRFPEDGDPGVFVEQWNR